MGFRLKAMTTASLGVAVTVIAAACSSSGSSSPGATGSASIKAGQPKSGGSITVLESKGYAGDWAAGLDPATDTSAIPNQDMMEAIYGQLFVQPQRQGRHDHAAAGREVQRRHPVQRPGRPVQLEPRLRAAGPEGGH